MWKTSKWTLHVVQFHSPRGLKASLSSGPLEITLVVVHFHHKHRRRQSQWKEIAKELHGPNLILCADHNSLIVQHRDAFAPPEFEYDTSLRAREQEVATLANAGLHDVYVDIHRPTLTDIKDKRVIVSDGLHVQLPSGRRATRSTKTTPHRPNPCYVGNAKPSDECVPHVCCHLRPQSDLGRIHAPLLRNIGHDPKILLSRGYHPGPRGNGRAGGLPQIYYLN